MVDKKEKWKMLIINDIMENASFYFIEWILGINDTYSREWDEYIILKVKFEWDHISAYQVNYLERLAKKYLKDDDKYSYDRTIRWQYFYITFEFNDF